VELQEGGQVFDRECGRRRRHVQKMFTEIFPVIRSLGLL